MRSFMEQLERFQTWITFGFLAIITIAVSVQVFVRYVLQRPLFLWTEELARFLLVWTVFLGIGVGVKNDAHFAMDVLPPLLGRRWGAIVRLFNDFCMGVILILLTLAGLRFSYFGLFQNSPNMEILMVWVFISIPLGGVLSLIYLIERIQQRVRDFRGVDQ
jgi:TRAP-type C4-dicarboxylate transport system permease small subunit